MIDYTPMQREAIDRAEAWFRANNDQVFRTFGYAGTGKTTIARAIADRLRDDNRKTHYCAFTGKASMVMRRAGCENAQTIHSSIYSVEIDDKGRATFRLAEDGPFADVDLIVVDECSMVGEEIGKDMLSFGKPILVLGDPAQLPPVSGGGFFTGGEPDVMLTEIHRQAEGNPIIRLASAVRKGDIVDLGAYGESAVVSAREMGKDRLAARVFAADQVLVGTNARRALYNQRMRQHYGRKKETPEIGDRIVCRRNDKAVGIFNGETFTVTKMVRSFQPDVIKLEAASADTGRDVDLRIRAECFTKGLPALKDLEWEDVKGTQQAEFAYALTVHLAQGSQWDDVVLFDDSGVFREDARRWLYTGITRAASRILIVRG